MSKFTFKLEQEDGLIIHKYSGDSRWPELLENFVNFLRGAGYHIDLGEWQPSHSTISNEELEELEQRFSERQALPEEFEFLKDVVAQIKIGAVVDVGFGVNEVIAGIGDSIIETSVADNTREYRSAYFVSKLLSKEFKFVNR